MRFSHRPHPLRTSRFWFLILACVAATSMWQFGMFPGQQDGNEEFVDLDLSDDAGSAASHSSGVPSSAGVTVETLTQTAMTPPPNWASTQAPVGQIEASDSTSAEGDWWANGATSEPDMLPAETAASAQPTQSVSVGQSHSQEESPFGPANPEFVALPDPYEGTTVTDSTQSQFPEWDAAPDATTQADVQTASARLVQPAGDETPQTQTTPAPTGTADTIEFTPAADGSVNFAEIDALLAQGDDVGAHRQLSTMYWEHPELRPQLMERIQQTARRIYFQPIPHYMEPYVVQPADTLQSIAHRYNVPWQFLAKLNEVEPTRIRPGQELKVIRGPFSAVVDLSDHEITVHAHGYFVCSFPVGIGRDGSTPTGTFEVEDKLVDPTYYGPDGVIAHDDPTNPLGEHWISIGNSYGIHGTIDPDSIGRDESQGCVRLRNEDVAEVYDFLSIGSEVVIRE